MTHRETDHTRHPVCPHCGHVERDAIEWLIGNDEDGETECGACDKPFRWSVHHSRTWTTTPKEVES